MPIYAPDKRINPTIRRKGGGGRKNVSAGLYLTSMVDMFAILVIFLLQSFSSEGELIILPKGLELPEAVNTGILSRAPVISVSREKIEFEGKEVAVTSQVAAQEGWVIPELQEALKDYRLKQEQKTQAQAPAVGGAQTPAVSGVEPENKVNISADRRLQFQVIKKVIYNASYAGYPDFRFAVFGRNPESSPTE